jgi:putative oxidoreductase
MFDPGKDGGVRDLGLLVLRVGFSFSLIYAHGHGKFMRLLGGNTQFPDPLGVGSGVSLGLASFAEFICAIAVILGLMTRWASVPIIILFAVAYFMIHGDDPFGEKEKAFLFLVAYVAILLVGPGRFSLDNYFSKK